MKRTDVVAPSPSALRSRPGVASSRWHPAERATAPETSPSFSSSFDSPLGPCPQPRPIALPASGFRFLPHSLILPPSSPPPLAKGDVVRVRVPIPRGLPPGPWEPLETAPPQITTDLQSSHGPGNRPGETGDRNVPWGSNFQKNHRLQHQNIISDYRRHNDGWNTASWGRAARSTENGRAGPVHAVRYQYEKKLPSLGDYRHSLTWKPKTTDQMRPQHSARKQKFKVEWVAVATKKNKKQSEEEPIKKKTTNNRQAMA